MAWLSLEQGQQLKDKRNKQKVKTLLECTNRIRRSSHLCNSSIKRKEWISPNLLKERPNDPVSQKCFLMEKKLTKTDLRGLAIT